MMHLFPSIATAYTQDRCSARDAQRQAELIAFGPIVFQASRVAVKSGLLSLLRDRGSLGIEELADGTGLSRYAVQVLMEASLSIGTVIVDPETETYQLTKTGWFLLTDPATQVNMDFNHDVNYEGFFHLEEALQEGKPAGLRHFGPWPTLYEGLSSLPEAVQKSWFAFDHFYSDHSFDEALPLIFAFRPRKIFDVGGNTGKWALRCVAYDPDVEVRILDLPQQLALMQEQVRGQAGAERISAYPINLLDPEQAFPEEPVDIIWMSQFLDCFSGEEVVGILRRAAAVMGESTRLCIMETLWDRQKYEAASLCLTMTSLYFTVMANGNSKMFSSDQLLAYIDEASLAVEAIHDGLGQGHSILICKKKKQTL